MAKRNGFADAYTLVDGSIYKCLKADPEGRTYKVWDATSDTVASGSPDVEIPELSKDELDKKIQELDDKGYSKESL